LRFCVNPPASGADSRDLIACIKESSYVWQHGRWRYAETCLYLVLIWPDMQAPACSAGYGGASGIAVCAAGAGKLQAVGRTVRDLSDFRRRNVYIKALACLQHCRRAGAEPFANPSGRTGRGPAADTGPRTSRAFYQRYGCAFGIASAIPNPAADTVPCTTKVGPARDMGTGQTTAGIQVLCAGPFEPLGSNLRAGFEKNRGCGEDKRGHAKAGLYLVLVRPDMQAIARAAAGTSCIAISAAGAGKLQAGGVAILDQSDFRRKNGYIKTLACLQHCRRAGADPFADPGGRTGRGPAADTGPRTSRAFYQCHGGAFGIAGAILDQAGGAIPYAPEIGPAINIGTGQTAAVTLVSCVKPSRTRGICGRQHLGAGVEVHRDVRQSGIRHAEAIPNSVVGTDNKAPANAVDHSVAGGGALGRRIVVGIVLAGAAGDSFDSGHFDITQTGARLNHAAHFFANPAERAAARRRAVVTRTGCGSRSDHRTAGGDIAAFAIFGPAGGTVYGACNIVAQRGDGTAQMTTVLLMG